MAPNLSSADVELIKQLRVVVFDFDGVFTDNSVFVFEDGSEAVRCSRSDGFGLRRIEQAGLKPYIVSAEANPLVLQRAKKLRIDAVNNCERKLDFLRSLAERYPCSLGHMAYVGNDVNDSECLAAVGFPIVVADAMQEVLHLGRYRTQKTGGNGAVREVCDLFTEIRLGSLPLIRK